MEHVFRWTFKPNNIITNNKVLITDWTCSISLCNHFLSRFFSLWQLRLAILRSRTTTHTETKQYTQHWEQCDHCQYQNNNNLRASFQHNKHNQKYQLWCVKITRYQCNYGIYKSNKPYKFCKIINLVQAWMTFYDTLTEIWWHKICVFLSQLLC